MHVLRLPATSIMMRSATHPQNNSSFTYRRCPSLKQVLEVASHSSWSSLQKLQNIFLIWVGHITSWETWTKLTSLLTSKGTDNISITILNSFQEALKALHIPRPLNNHVNTNRRRQVQTGEGAIRICTSLIIIHRYWKSGKLCFHPRYPKTCKLDSQPAIPSKSVLDS